jgi:hypothetical protein
MGHSKILGGRATVTTMVGVVALVWALCLVGTTSSSRDLDMDSDLVETETGWQFSDGDDDDNDDAEMFSAPSGAPSSSPKGGIIPLINGDFELTNITGANATVNVDNTTTLIINWVVGGPGVQVLMSATYGVLNAKIKSVFCIHLNYPPSTNFTQGSLSTTLATTPATGKTYTVQYDICRAPDGPLNIYSAIKLSAAQGATVKDWVIHYVKYNISDKVGSSSWTRQSFIYHGTGASTVIKLESMSERYGPIIDNVETLSGSHQLAGAPLPKVSGLCQRLLTALSLLALALAHVF